MRGSHDGLTRGQHRIAPLNSTAVVQEDQLFQVKHGRHLGHAHHACQILARRARRVSHLRNGDVRARCLLDCIEQRQLSSTIIALPPARRTRRSFRTGSPSLICKCSATSGVAPMRSRERTSVSNVIPCCCSEAANENGRSPPGCAICGSLTKVPRPCSCCKRPSSTSVLIALRTVPRLTSNKSIRLCSDGMRSPVPHSLAKIFDRI